MFGCVREGYNNDTNLTFGEPNKFYLMTQSGSQGKGSISDELIFLEPVQIKEIGEKELAFVFDRVYGVCTPDILINQLLAVFKKYVAIKNRYPNIKISIFVSKVALDSTGTETKKITQAIEEQKGNLNVIVEQKILTVDVVKSVIEDNYIEFGGNARESGTREVSGILIKI